MCIYLYKNLVGGFNPSEKYESQWKGLFPYIMEIKFMFQTTNQVYYIAYELWLAILLTIYWLYIINNLSIYFMYTHYVYIYIYHGWWFQPLWKIWVIIKMVNQLILWPFSHRKLLVYRRVYIYIYIWVNYNMSLTWIKASHGEDSPKINHD